MKMDTDKILKDLTTSVQNATIDACCKAAMLCCEKSHMKDYPMTTATMICNQLQMLKVSSD